MSGTPRSKEFDDVYFSVENGLAETRYVFLKGNDLPNAWSGRDRFVIAETGFGTGLNFLAAWKMFEDTAEDGQELDFISVEKFPLDRQEIALYLQRWGDEFDGYLERMLEIYPALIPGFHRLNLNDHVRLTIIVDDDAAQLQTGDKVRRSPIDILARSKPVEANDTNEDNFVEGFLPIWGTFVLQKGEQIEGYMVFEVPKGSTFRQFRWSASDTAIVNY